MAIFNGTLDRDFINRSTDIESAIIYGLTGDDTLIGGSADDTLNGGSGVDSLTGGAGDDTYYVNNVFDARSRRYLFDVVIENSVAGSGIDTVVTDVKGYYLAANVENLISIRGGDAHGNELNNIISGSLEVDSIEAFEGDDTIYGGGGNDILAGGQGNDSIEGGDGNDNIWGDSDLVVDGWFGHDVLRGGNGNDYIKGGGGNDTLYGDTGNDTLVASTGDSTLYGGDGDDTYYITPDLISRGISYHSTNVIETGTTGVDTIIVNASPQTFFGTVVMSANVENMIIQTYGAFAGNTYGAFAGNSQNNIISTASYVRGRTLQSGAGGNDFISGSDDVDWSAGGDGNDTILGNAGDDSLFGGGDLFGYADTLQQLDGNDSIRGGVGNDTIWGDAGSDILFGDEGNDLIYGSDNGQYRPFTDDGNDTISGGTGNDTLIDVSTTSSDLYIWGRGDGADNLSDNGGIDRLDVLPGVNTNQVWLRHIGNNLEISLIGTGDSFTVNNWYGSSANQVESIRLSDGKTLFANKVDNLVNAMAALTPPAAGQTTLPANYQTALNPVIAANWA